MTCFFCQKKKSFNRTQFFFGYFLIQLFGGKIDALELTTTENKFRVVSFFVYSENVDAIRKIFRVEKLSTAIYNQFCNLFKTITTAQNIF